MKFSAAAVVVSLCASFAAAAIDKNIFPQCSIQCLDQAVAQSGCASDDAKCQCTTGRDKITQVATPCILTSCSNEDAAKVGELVDEQCAANSGGSSSAGSSSGAASATSKAAASASSAVSSAAAQATTNAAATFNGGVGAGIGAIAAGMMLL